MAVGIEVHCSGCTAEVDRMMGHSSAHWGIEACIDCTCFEEGRDYAAVGNSAVAHGGIGLGGPDVGHDVVGLAGWAGAPA